MLKRLSNSMVRRVELFPLRNGGYIENLLKFSWVSIYLSFCQEQ